MESGWNIIAQVTIPRISNIIAIIVGIELIFVSQIYSTSSPLTQTALLTLLAMLDYTCLTKKGVILERKFREIKNLGGKDIFWQDAINEPRDSVIDRDTINELEFVLLCDVNVVTESEITKLQDCNICCIVRLIIQSTERMAYHFLLSYLTAYLRII